MAEEKSLAVIGCRVCGLAHEVEPLEEGTIAVCRRCGSRIAKRTRSSLHLTAAFSLAALILFVPANIFPILRLELYGATQENTVWQGVVRLYQDGDFVVAGIVFLASMVIPVLKLLGLFFMVVTSRFNFALWKKPRTWLYRIIEGVGRWAMLDVFVLAILVSLVKLQGLATVIPGKGLLAFTLVVVCTLLASACFDPQMIWEKEESAA